MNPFARCSLDWKQRFRRERVHLWGSASQGKTNSLLVSVPSPHVEKHKVIMATTPGSAVQCCTSSEIPEVTSPSTETTATLTTAGTEEGLPVFGYPGHVFYAIHYTAITSLHQRLGQHRCRHSLFPGKPGEERLAPSRWRKTGLLSSSGWFV